MASNETNSVELHKELRRRRIALMLRPASPAEYPAEAEERPEERPSSEAEKAEEAEERPKRQVKSALMSSTCHSRFVYCDGSYSTYSWNAVATTLKPNGEVEDHTYYQCMHKTEKECHRVRTPQACELLSIAMALRVALEKKLRNPVIVYDDCTNIDMIMQARTLGEDSIPGPPQLRQLHHYRDGQS